MWNMRNLPPSSPCSSAEIVDDIRSRGGWLQRPRLRGGQEKPLSQRSKVASREIDFVTFGHQHGGEAEGAQRIGLKIGSALSLD